MTPEDRKNSYFIIGVALTQKFSILIIRKTIKIENFMQNKHNIKPRIKASDLPNIISPKSALRKTVQDLIKIYIFALMLKNFHKSLTSIASIFGVSLSSLSRMLSNPLLTEELNISINRKTRKIIAAYLNKNKEISIDIIIDATLIERSSKGAQNVGLYHSNGKKTTGHRFTNIGLLLDGKLYIPLACLPHYTRSFSKKLKSVIYRTEGTMVCDWLRDYMENFQIFLSKGGVKSEDIFFLLDAGYDNKKIQKQIIEIGCNFIMMVKNTRKINDVKISNFFKSNRYLKWQSIYFNKIVNNKKKRKKYRIRTKTSVTLFGVGLVTAVCSEKASGRGKKLTRRYIVCSKQSLSGRKIIQAYARRWMIETWHKEIKQNYGFESCSCHKFASIENHIKLCITAYLYHLENLKSLPMKGTSLEDFLQYSIRKQSRQTLNLISGKQRFNQQLEEHHENIFPLAA